MVLLSNNYKMKQLLLLWFLCTAFFVAAQPLAFENNLRNAFEKAKLENKPVFIEYYNSDCPVCIRVGDLFVSNEKLVSFYNKSFVNYRIDTHKISKTDSLFVLNTKLSFTSIPYFLFFDSNENLLHVSAINVDADVLIKIGLTALNPNERDSGLATKYSRGDRSIKTLYAYSLLVKLYNNDSLTTVLADDLYKSFPKTELGTKRSYVITKNCVNSIENGFFKFWIKNMDKLEAFESEKHKGEGKEMLGEIVRKSIFSKSSKNWNKEKIAEVKKYILLTGLSEHPDAFFLKTPVVGE
jgi:thiol-disulfide isomerase/thioredoxin